MLPVLKKKIFAMSLISLAFIYSCVNDIDLSDFSKEAVIDQSLVIPVGEANITLADILNQINMSDIIGTEGTSIYAYYRDSLDWMLRDISFMDGLVPLSQSIYLSPGGTVALPPNTTDSVETGPLSFYLGFNVNPTQQRIDILRANSGVMTFNISKTDLDISPSDITLRLIFQPNIFAFNTGASYIDVNPTAFGTPFDVNLDAFSMYTTNLNDLPLVAKLYLRTGNTPLVLTSSSKIDINFNFTSFDTKVIYGHFNPTLSDLDQEKVVDIPDLSEYIPNAYLKLAEPEMNFTIQNKTGVKIGINLEYIKAYVKNDASYTPIYAKFKNGSTATQIVLNAAAEYGSTGLTEYTMDKDSGQLDALFDNEKLADALAYKFNVNNVRTEGIDFIMPHAKIRAICDIKVPLHLKSGSYYELNDTIGNLKLDSIIDLNYAQKAIVILNIKNGLPVATTFDLKLLDENDNEVSTTIEKSYNIAAPGVDDNGLTISDQITTQKLQLEVNKDQLESLRLTKKIAYKVRIATAEGKPLNFRTTDSFGVKVGVFVKGDKSFNLF